MGEISTLGGLPNSVSLSTPAEQTKRAANNQNTPPATNTSVPEDATTSEYQTQLSRLSSVLSGLQLNASKVRTQAVQAANQIKSGNYQVNPLEISKSIVSDLLKPGISPSAAA